MGFKGSNMKKSYEQLQLGMKKQDVLTLLGNPDSQTVKDGVEVLGWSSKEWKGLVRGGFLERTISIEFKNDVVVGINGNNIHRSAL